MRDIVKKIDDLIRKSFDYEARVLTDARDLIIENDEDFNKAAKTTKDLRSENGRLKADRKRLIATLAGLLKYDGGDGEYDAGLFRGYRNDAKEFLSGLKGETNETGE